MEQRVQSNSLFQKLLGAGFALWFFSALVLIGIFFFSRYFVSQTVNDILVAKQEILSTQKKIDNFSGLKREKARSLAYQEKLNIIFSSREKLFNVISSLEDQAQLEGLQQFFSFGAEAEGDSTRAKNIGFSLTLNGSLNSFLSYIKKIEGLDILLNFSSVEANSKSDGSYQINSTGQIYLK